MPYVFTLRETVQGAHVHVDVFVSPEGRDGANAGRLVLRPEEAQAFGELHRAHGLLGGGAHTDEAELAALEKSKAEARDAVISYLDKIRELEWENESLTQERNTSEAGAAAMRSALTMLFKMIEAAQDVEACRTIWLLAGETVTAALSSTAGAEMLERLEEWKQRARIEEGNVRMHLELRRAAEAERDRLRKLCGDAAEALEDDSRADMDLGDWAELAARLKGAAGA